MGTSQLERIKNDVAAEDDVPTPTKWWIAGLPEDNRAEAAFVENVDDVIAAVAR